MSSILTSDKLIASIKRRGFIPRSQETFSNDDFLEMATEEINLGIMEKLINARGDYLVYFQDVPLVEDTLLYSIPSRAHGNKLRDAHIVDKDGQSIYELSQISLEERIELNNYSSYQKRTNFYMENDCIVLHEDIIKPEYSLRMWFYMRPNKLVQNARAGVVTQISTNTELNSLGETIEVVVATVSTMPAHFSSAIMYDSILSESPNKLSHFNLTPNITNTTLKTISFPKALAKNLKVGDYITKAEESIVPNIPTELHPIIAQKVAIACLEAMGDEQNKQSAERKLAQMEKSAISIISNRIEGSPKKIKNRFGTLNSGKKIW